MVQTRGSLPFDGKNLVEEGAFPRPRTRRPATELHSRRLRASRVLSSSPYGAPEIADRGALRRLPAPLLVLRVSPKGGGQCAPAGEGRLRDGDRARIREGAPGTAGNHQSRDSVRPAVLRTEPRVPTDYVLIAASLTCETRPTHKSGQRGAVAHDRLSRHAEVRNQRIGLAGPAARSRSRCREAVGQRSDGSLLLKLQ
jgi:hypothetical protein